MSRRLKSRTEDSSCSGTAGWPDAPMARIDRLQVSRRGHKKVLELAVTWRGNPIYIRQKLPQNPPRYSEILLHEASTVETVVGPTTKNTSHNFSENFWALLVEFVTHIQTCLFAQSVCTLQWVCTAFLHLINFQTCCSNSVSTAWTNNICYIIAYITRIRRDAPVPYWSRSGRTGQVSEL